MICTRCGWATRCWPELSTTNTMQRCARCGTPHSCALGREPEALGPRLLPITAGTQRLSIWMPPYYSPCESGVYECHFHGGEHLRLRWLPRAWTWCGKLVDVSTLMKWRGRWADT